MMQYQCDTELLELLVPILETIASEAASLGLEVNWQKTKVQPLSCREDMPLTIKVQGQDIMVVEEFVYLGSLIHSSTGSTCDISRRSAITRAAMLRKSDLEVTARHFKLYQYSCMVRTAGQYLRRTHVRLMYSTSGVCVCCLASKGTNLYGMMMYGG